MPQTTANQKRACRVSNLLDRSDYEPEFVLRDLLSDLKHYCDQQGYDFDDELRIATAHYFAETRGEG